MLSSTLRTSIADLHARIEATPMAQLLVDGRISRLAHAALLGQLLPVHRRLEMRLVEEGSPRQLPTEQTVRSPAIANDLATFASAVPLPLPATITVCAWLDGAGSPHRRRGDPLASAERGGQGL